MSYEWLEGHKMSNGYTTYTQKQVEDKISELQEVLFQKENLPTYKFTIIHNHLVAAIHEANAPDRRKHA